MSCLAIRLNELHEAKFTLNAITLYIITFHLILQNVKIAPSYLALTKSYQIEKATFK